MRLLALLPVLLLLLQHAPPPAAAYGGLNVNGDEDEDAVVVRVARSVLCRVCETAVLEVAKRARRENLRSEDALETLASSFCPKSNQIHNALPGHEVIETRAGAYVFRAKPSSARKGYVQDHLNRGMQHACQLSVAEHDTELAEALYLHFRDARPPSLATVKREFCYSVGACPDEARRSRERAERAALEARRAPELARERAEEAEKQRDRESRDL